MTTISTFINRHPVVSYFVLTFAISWGSLLLVIGGPAGLPATPEQFDRLMPLVVLTYVAGPSIASLLLTGFLCGRTGLHELLSLLLRWRVGVRWYAVALLTAPLLTAAIFFALSLVSPDFLPVIITTDEKSSLLLLAIVVGLAGGFLEELGWTGFAIHRLKPRYGVLATGLIVGVLWGASHFLVNAWWSGTNSGGLPLAIFLPLYFLIGVAQLTAYRVLMVWVYDRAESLLVAILMHASLIVSTVVLVPPATGVAFLTWFLVFTVALWVDVAAVAVVNGGHLSPRRLRMQAA